MELEKALLKANDNGFALLDYNDLRRSMRTRRIRDGRLERDAQIIWEDLCQIHQDLPRSASFKLIQFKGSNEMLLLRSNAAESIISLDAPPEDDDSED